MNFFDSSLAYVNPSDMSIFSQIFTISGTTIAQLLKRAFKFSGSSVLPAYPGFIVIKKPVVNLIRISSKSMNMNMFLVGFVLRSFMASRQYLTYVETTESTSIEILLNSSKQPQEPVYARPMKI
tara:strand:- start:1196 stop:1567 length:372 start_codon:yes stop_codon:yes gene_type:complete